LPAASNSWHATLTADIVKIIDTAAALFGDGVPYDDYTFICMLAPNQYGGLEHKKSCALLTSPFTFHPRKKYEEFLELVSHEFFHLWNVKRIHPRALGPFDYQREAYTRSLWVMEGVTSYYDRRAAGPLSSEPGGVELRRLDQALSPRRELAQLDHLLLFEGRGGGALVRSRDPLAHPRRALARRRDAASVEAARRARDRLSRRRRAEAVRGGLGPRPRRLLRSLRARARRARPSAAAS